MPRSRTVWPGGPRRAGYGLTSGALPTLHRGGWMDGMRRAKENKLGRQLPRQEPVVTLNRVIDGA